MRRFTIGFLTCAVLASTAVAGMADPIAPLPPGKAAGVKEAALHAPLWVWIAGIGFVALGVGLVASGNKNGVTTPSTTGTGS